jgi:tetratricopeptide (TPR) repeat protein
MMKALLILLVILLASCHSQPNCDVERVEFVALHGRCEPVLQLADCFWGKGNFEFAAYNYIAYLKDCDTTYEILVNTVDGLFKSDKSEQALPLAKRCMAKYPDQRLSYYNLAVIEFNREKYLEALMILEDYPDLESDHELCFLAFEAAWFADYYETAYRHVRRAIELKPDEDEYRTRYAALLCSYEEFEKALEIVKPVYERIDDTAYYHFSLTDLLVSIYFSLGDTTEACILNEELNRKKEFAEIYLENLNTCETKSRKHNIH